MRGTVALHTGTGQSEFAATSLLHATADPPPRCHDSVSTTMNGDADLCRALGASEALAAGFDPETLPTAFFDEPYPTYAALRAHDPVHRCSDSSYFLTRYADVDFVYRDRTHFSSDKKAVFAPKYGLESPLYAHHTTSLVFNDPPYHTRVRRQIIGALSPAAIKGMIPGLAALIDRLCDDIERKSGFDLIEDFAAAIPVEVIGNLLGVPREERGALRRWSLGILGALDPALSAPAIENGNRCVVEFVEFTRALVSERRRRLRGDDDLLSRLIRDETGGEHLHEFELLHNCIFLLNAGHETTTNLIGNGLALLLNDVRSRQLLAQNPALIGPAVEECLRYESPNQLGNRMVVSPVELGGRLFSAGTYLTLCIGAANRDPAAFKNPGVFDIARDPNRHLAFGAGSHGCAGMSVARLEGQMAIAGFLHRFPQARVETGAVRSRRARFRGFVSLPAAIE
jgi:cytochrome P450